jgi:hypothetical protein
LPSRDASSAQLRDPLSGFGYDPSTKKRTGNMSDFNYSAPAVLFAAQGRSGLRYRRFLYAAEAVRYVVEKLPSDARPSARLEVEDKCYDAGQIRTLYDNAPTRRIPAQ